MSLIQGQPPFGGFGGLILSRPNTSPATRPTPAIIASAAGGQRLNDSLTAYLLNFFSLAHGVLQPRAVSDLFLRSHRDAAPST